ncbi:hypothetical protein [Ectopseudomonas khazarica]|uniref:hypothetical protein n=1 Tax=Ectopseudomonas khazarica TaxID=2502979 RepID=UPI00106EAAF0|nr:hypothetical protein [Pseudomonas khazarica]
MTVGDILIKLGQPEHQWVWQLARVAVPAVLIIIGWKVVSSDQNSRETRKEKRQLLDRAIELITEIGNDAVTMYVTTDDAEYAKLSANIAPRLQRLEGMLQVLSLKDAERKNVAGSALRESITMINIYLSDTKPSVAATDQRLYTIHVEVSALIKCLELSYQATYHR